MLKRFRGIHYHINTHQYTITFLMCILIQTSDRCLCNYVVSQLDFILE